MCVSQGFTASASGRVCGGSQPRVWCTADDELTGLSPASCVGATSVDVDMLLDTRPSHPVPPHTVLLSTFMVESALHTSWS